MQCGYSGSLKEFIGTNVPEIIKQLEKFIPDSGESQIRAWRDSINLLRRIVQVLADQHTQLLSEAFVILEYHVPLESRRIDALLLVRGSAIVVEFKGKQSASQADIDQAAAYARDLRAYHRACSSLNTTCFLVPTRYLGAPYVLPQSEMDFQTACCR